MRLWRASEAWLGRLLGLPQEGNEGLRQQLAEADRRRQMIVVYFIAMCASWAVGVINLFDHNLPLALVFGVAAFPLGWMFAEEFHRRRERGGSTHNTWNTDNRQTHHHWGQSGPIIGVHGIPLVPPHPSSPAHVHEQYARDVALAQAAQVPQIGHAPALPSSLPDIEVALQRRYIVREEAEVQFVPAALPPQLQALLGQQQQPAPQPASRPLTVVASQPALAAPANDHGEKPARLTVGGVARMALLGPPRKVAR